MNGRASQPGGVLAVTAIFSSFSCRQRHRLTDHLPANWPYAQTPFEVRWVIEEAPLKVEPNWR